MTINIRLSQQEETNIVDVERSHWNYRYAYARSAEAKANGDIGQDYLTLIEEKDYIAFALCDGVSMSYFGDFAAQFVGDSLIEWLKALDESMSGAEMLSGRLNQYLIEKAGEAGKKLDNYPLPPGINGMFREVLLSKKSLGSGTMYSCGRIDKPGPAYPQGRIVLAWQGDSRIRIWSGARERADLLGDRFHTRERWNSVSGPVGGTPHVYAGGLTPLGETGAVLLYSDGLQAIDGAGRINSDMITGHISRESMNPSSDDMSVFHLQWHCNK
ncbi:hypothetical protein ACFQZE_10815 [Paenibacillus sp. GCM10027627]|uniref:hypothetical protein n=1 Tax=unclassified Paenibacillus TaxID=185978 RepID=UPI00362ABBFE